MPDEIVYEKPPTVGEEVRLKKTQRGAKNAGLIAETIKRVVEEVGKEVDQPGKAQVEVFTLIVGTPSSGFYTAEIEVRVIWLRRKVPGVSNVDKQKFVTFMASYMVNGKVVVSPYIVSQMLIDTQTNKPIENTYKVASIKIESDFMDWVSSIWTQNERKNKYRMPSVRNAVFLELEGSNKDYIGRAIVDTVAQIAPNVVEKGKSDNAKINFLAGNNEIGYFKMVALLNVTYGKDDVKTASISATLWFGQQMEIDLGEVGEFFLDSLDNKINRSDLVPILNILDSAFSKFISKSISAQKTILRRFFNSTYW